MMNSSKLKACVQVIAMFVLAGGLAVSAAAQDLTFTTLAGSAPGTFDGTGSAARFHTPSHVAVDGSGNLYVADTYNHTIRKVTSSGVVTTLAGGYGDQDGSGSAARFAYPTGVAVDASGNVYVADSDNHAIRKITAAGVVSTLAGLPGNPGSADGTGRAARFDYPNGVAVDTSGTVYVTDSGNHTIRKITSGGVVTTLAGSAGNQGSDDATGSAARFYHPRGIAVDTSGNLFVADHDNHTIRKITAAGVVTTFAGLAGNSGTADDTGSAARFAFPSGVAVDDSGNVYVGDTANQTIRKISSGGVVTTLAGSAATSGSTDGTGGAARFRDPYGVAVDSGGLVYVADQSNQTIRKIDDTFAVSTLAGSVAGDGSADGTVGAARFYHPTGVAVDASGNAYVADQSNHTIRKISVGTVTTLAGLAGQSGSVDDTGGDARFTFPSGLAVDGTGDLYVADRNNQTIRKVTSAGVVTTLAGLAGEPGSADGTGTAALFNSPSDVAVDSSGNVYVADRENHTIRKVTSAGVVTTLAGLAGNPGSADGTGSAARFNNPTGIALSADETILYIADLENHTIRKLTVAGVVTTLAGLAGSEGNTDGTGSDARFSYPSGLAEDGSGNVYVADSNNHTIRKVTSAGVVTTFAGFAGHPGSADGTGSAARFDSLTDLAFDATGNLYVADRGNNTIRFGSLALGGAITVTDPSGFVGATHTLGFTGAATTTDWRVTRMPSTSGAALSSETDATPTFTPDVPDTYQIELTASDGIDKYVGRVELASPQVSVSSKSVTEGAIVPVDISLSEAMSGTVTLDWATKNGTADSASDYSSGSGSLTFNSGGQTTQTVVVFTNQDTLDENDETFFVELSNVTGGVQNGGSGVVTITDDDPTPTLSIDDIEVVEGNSGTTDAVFTVTLSAASSFTVSCDVGTSGGTANGGGSDYWDIEDTITFAPGETTKTVTVQVVGETDIESDETFFVDLYSPTNATIADGEGQGTIVDDDTPTLTIDDVSVSEGDSGTTNAVFTVTLAPAAASTVTVDYATADQTATAGSDYTSASGMLTFDAGQTSKTVTVVVSGDTIDENNETFAVNLSNVTGGDIGDAQGVGTITDDDPLPTVSIGDVEVAEGNSGNSNVELTVTLSEASGRSVPVDWSTMADGTATAGSDFVSAIGSLTILAGETSKTITVQVVGDTIAEPDETFSVHISAEMNATAADDTGVVTILNDDVFGAPTGLTATATSSTSVSLSWNTVTDAVLYQVYRSTSGTSYGFVGSTASTAFVDSGASPATAYLYAVRAIDAGDNPSAYSSPDLATTVIFTDPTITTGTTMAKAAHVTELRTAVNAVRTLAGLSGTSFTDPTLTSSVTLIKRIHVTELRTALDAARSALGLASLSYTDPTITAGVSRVKAAHISELRSGVQ